MPMPAKHYDDGLSSLILLMLVFVLLLVAAVMWCLLSSCMGVSIREFFSTVWESALLGARMDANDPVRRHRPHAFGEEEVWEMEYRGRGI